MGESRQVSILVVMERTHRLDRQITKRGFTKVSILVVMERTHRLLWLESPHRPAKFQSLL